MALNIEQIHHVAYRCKDAKETVEWYGRVLGMESRSGYQVAKVHVPLSEMFGYATDLRSQTQGRATYTMQFDHYDEVPQPIADEIVARVTGMTA